MIFYKKKSLIKKAVINVSRKFRETNFLKFNFLKSFFVFVFLIFSLLYVSYLYIIPKYVSEQAIQDIVNKYVLDDLVKINIKK